MARLHDLRQKEVINIKDGSRYGFVSDIEIDEYEGTILEIIVPGPAKIFGLFGHDQEYHIDWSSVCQIGDDIILVDVDTRKVLKNCER